MNNGQASPQFVLPKPGPVLKLTLAALFAIWLIFALGMNWAGVSPALYQLLTVDPAQVLAGEIWRPLTGALIHHPNRVGHILGSLLGLYFLGASLEEKWGGARFARFLALSAFLSYGTQVVLLQALPVQIGYRLAPDPGIGAIPVVEAVAIAWACSFKGQQVRLMFVLPVSSRMLILFVVGLSLLRLIAVEHPYSGHIAVFAGMGFGWLLGGGSPSPLRKLYLRYRLRSLDQQAKRDGETRKRKVKKSGFRVIEGGGGDDDDQKMLH